MSTSREHISILALQGEPLFFQHFDGPYYPTLKILHRCKLFLWSHTQNGNREANSNYQFVPAKIPNYSLEFR